MSEAAETWRPAEHRRFLLQVSVSLCVVLALPAIYGLALTPTGSRYLGYPINADDHMVYAAWMRQAMAGQFRFQNLFTTDPQPGVTIHVFFLILGFVARLLGIFWTTLLARLALSAILVWQLDNLIGRLGLSVRARKFALALSLVGGGLGFLTWHNFGLLIVKPGPEILNGFYLGRLPIDNWQPEAFLFPSLLTNALFAASLVLILGIFISILDARHSWKSAGWGALGLAVLMNIHSYDVLLIALVGVVFLGCQVASRGVTSAWLMRTAVIAAGAIPPAMYFLWVLRQDAVFQARAATETYSPNFRSVLFGLLPLMALAFGGWSLSQARRRYLGAGLLAAVLAGMSLGAANHADGYFLGPAVWAGVFIIVAVAAILLSTGEPAYDLILSWAMVGTIAIYFPALFQRKLAMGLSIPWAILAAIGLAKLVRPLERPSRQWVAALVLIVSGATSLRWLVRDLFLIRSNVSNTTVHALYLGPDETKILDYLDKVPDPKVVIAPPGHPSSFQDPATGKPVPDEFGTPAITDLNPIVSGLTGAKTFAGHWSETPSYLRRRGRLDQLFFGNQSPDHERDTIAETGADYIISPTPEAFGDAVTDLRRFGSVVVDGNRFRLIRVRKP